MKTIFSILLCAVLATASSLAQMPSKIHYQGVLNDQNGNAVNGPRSMEFRLYDVLTGGTPLWSQGPQNVQVNKGGFNVVLGPFPPEVDFSIPYYFELVVEGSVLSPREELASAPYALRSANSDRANHADRSDHSNRSDSAGRADRADRADRSDHSNRADIADSLADNTVTSPKIVDGSILFVDIGQNDATVGQVMKWNGAAWVAGDDNAGSGGSVSQVNTGSGLTGGPITTSGTISISEGGVTTTHLAGNAVTSAKIIDGGVTNADLANSTITINTGAGLTGGGAVTLGGSITLSSSASGTFLPLAGGTMTGAILSTGDPEIKMGKGNFGQGNLNVGLQAFVAGSNNRAWGAYSVVSGGGGENSADSNSATGRWSTVGGGTMNTAGGSHSTVGDGLRNTSGLGATIGGGSINSAIGVESTIGGGGNNTAGGESATVGGGVHNSTSGVKSTIGGGDHNTATGVSSTISGGTANTASGDHATIGGGYDNAASGAHSTVGGGWLNKARGRYSVVSGGGGPAPGDSNSATGDHSTVGGGSRNIASGANSTIGGGGSNTASDASATVGGGAQNRASYFGATVGGGIENTASYPYATIPGGFRNIAEGPLSFAAGYIAYARHTGAFVWADANNYPNPDLPFVSERENQFRVRATGGGRFDVNNSRWVNIWDDGTNLISTSTGARLSTGGVWTNASDRNLKENFAAVDGKAILETLASLPISIWNYKSESPSVKHIGPTAQDFYEKFRLNKDDKSISTIDPAGIALAAIQQLKKENDAMRAELQKLQEQVRLLLGGTQTGSSQGSSEQIIGELRFDQ